jgi:hypothetical protein
VLLILLGRESDAVKVAQVIHRRLIVIICLDIF